jgi:hypothetical protein
MARHLSSEELPQENLQRTMDETRSNLLDINKVLADHMKTAHNGRMATACHTCLSYNVLRQSSEAMIIQIEDILQRRKTQEKIPSE